MPLAQNTELPTLEEAFGDNPMVMKALNKAKIRSVAPLMLLPKESLLNDIPGIGHKNSMYIMRVLAEYELGHHEYHERLRDFVDRQFGDIENPPIEALQVGVVSGSYGTIQTLVPIRLVSFLAEYEPRLLIGDVARRDSDDIRSMLSMRLEFGPVIELFASDIKLMNQRLVWWDPDFKITIKRKSHLRAVND